MGVGLKSGSSYVEPPTITTVWPSSPAAEAGWQQNDTIIAMNGTPVETQAQLQFLLKPRYAGEKVTLSVRRGTNDSAEEFDSEITLADKLAPFRHSFLGILPATSSDDEGVEVGEVWPAGPAAEAGILPLDRIRKIGTHPIRSLPEAWAALQNLQPGEAVKIALLRGSDELTLQSKLSTLPEQILAKLSATIGDIQPMEPLEPQLLKLPEFPQEAHFLEPKTPESQRPGLVIWLGSGKEDEEQALFESWQESCQREGIILVVARPGADSGWQSDDLEYLEQLTRLATSRFRPHPRQTVLAGQDKGGQLAYALAFKSRRIFSGVISDNAPLPRTLQIPENTPSGQLAVLSILPQNSTFATLVKHDIGQLRQEGYPVSRLMRSPSPELDDATIATIGRWIVGLNRF